MSTRWRVGRVLAAAVAVAVVGAAAGFGAFAASAASTHGRAESRRAPVPVRHTTLRWEALGDSYSAGVGSDDGPAACGHGHLYSPYSSRAEPSFAATSAVPLTRFELLACGGATVATIERDQVPRTRGADIVTLTAGGNDIGFTQFVEDCFLLTPSRCPSDLPASTWSSLHAHLVDLYVRIGRAMHADGSTDGQLFVLTYPIPFSVPDLHKSWSCWLFDHGYHEQALLANALAERLDDEIVDAARSASDELRRAGQVPDVHVVDWRTATGAPQVLHLSVRGVASDVATNPDGICSGHAMTHLYRETLGAPGGQDSFHPTQRGYDIGADRLLAALAHWFPSSTGSPRRSAPLVFCAVLHAGADPRSSCRPEPPPPS